MVHSVGVSLFTSTQSQLNMRNVKKWIMNVLDSQQYIITILYRLMQQ